MLKCKVCKKDLYDKPLLELTNMPASAQYLPDKDALVKDKGINLSIHQCSGCGLVQIPSSPVHYFREVIRAVGISKEMTDFRLKQFTDFVQKYKVKKIVEIGSGFGEYLEIMNKVVPEAYGIEYSQKGVQNCQSVGLKVVKGYIEDENYTIPNAPFDSFFIMSFLEHIPNITSFLGGLRKNLTDKAVGLVEVPNFDMILEKQLFSEFILDHLYYFTEETLRTTLEINGFEVIECKPVWHNYILSAVVRKKSGLDISEFKNTNLKIKKELNEFINENGKTAIWGAGHQALAVMSLAELGGRIEYVVDSAKFKQGKYTPATHIPIVSPEYFIQNPVPALIVMAGSYSDEVVSSLKNYKIENLKIAVLRDYGLEFIN